MEALKMEPLMDGHHIQKAMQVSLLIQQVPVSMVLMLHWKYMMATMH